MFNPTVTSSFSDVVNVLIGGINNIVTVLIVLALIVFMWGIIRFIYSANDSRDREQGKKFILWGLVTLFVLASIWGIMGILCTTFITSYSCIA
jgi:ABC-type branched-subunit amino acid transport system permease subunit